jgi:hypothetical protein
MIDSIEQINKSEYLFLTSIEEFSGNNVRLNVQEGRATGALAGYKLPFREIRVLICRPENPCEPVEAP